MNGPESFIWWDWIPAHAAEIREATIEHLALTVSSVGVGFVMALAMGMASVRWRAAYAPLAAVSGAMYAIPSLALFGLLVPITGLGFRTAHIALTSYTLLILLRSIVEGIDAVPAEVKDAADGMGYEPWRRYITVDLRLATPVIVAGLRVATVSVVGLVTVAALVGTGGYGRFIDDGLNRSFSTPIVVGGGLSVAMALALDGLFAILQRAATPWVRAAHRGAG